MNSSLIIWQLSQIYCSMESASSGSIPTLLNDLNRTNVGKYHVQWYQLSQKSQQIIVPDPAPLQ